MRRHRRGIRQIKKQRKLIIILLICFLFIMVGGYSAFQTNLNITAKGNIKDYNAAWQLTKNVVTSGDGLYEDFTEEGRYVYKGLQPNNYINFNNELWRIIAVEPDETIKIIKNTYETNTINYDESDSTRYSENGYCTDDEGCNFWASNSTTLDKNKKNTTQIEINGVKYALPEKVAKANDYLNSTGGYINDGFYYNLSMEDKGQLVKHDFAIGIVFTDNNIIKTMEEENKYYWNGYVGLLNISDYLKSYVNDNSNSYLTTGNWYWLINPFKDTRNQLWSVHCGLNYGGTVYWGIGSSVGITPVVYLNSNIKLTGIGTEDKPYKIKT